MKVIVGLGNPGKRYANTRHNVGFMYLDFLVEKFSTDGTQISWEQIDRFKAEVAEFSHEGQKYALIKPQTYMNESGWSVTQFLSWHKVKPEKILLVHDDLDIPLGKFKFNTEKSPKIHYGVMSVEGYLKTKGFTRLRIGVDNRAATNIRRDGVSYVMEHFPEEEKEILHKVFDESFVEVERTLKKNNK
jgi:PTH1 family peptidyl-tRNA hydrolase